MCISKPEASFFSLSDSQNELNKYTDIKKNFSALNDIAFWLLGSLQNNTIDAECNKILAAEMREVLFGYDAKKILTITATTLKNCLRLFDKPSR